MENDSIPGNTPQGNRKHSTSSSSSALPLIATHLEIILSSFLLTFLLVIQTSMQTVLYKVMSQPRFFIYFQESREEVQRLTKTCANMNVNIINKASVCTILTNLKVNIRYELLYSSTQLSVISLSRREVFAGFFALS